MPDYYCSDCGERLANMYASGHECKHQKPEVEVKGNGASVMVYREEVVRWVYVRIDDCDSEMTASELEEKYRARAMVASQTGWVGEAVLDTSYYHTDEEMQSL